MQVLHCEDIANNIELDMTLISAVIKLDSQHLVARFINLMEALKAERLFYRIFNKWVLSKAD